MMCRSFVRLVSASFCSSEIITSIYMSAIFGAVFLGLWAFFRGPLRHIYLKRTQLSDLHARPPPLCMVGLWSRATSFLAPVFFLDDGEFVATAGLDALVRLGQGSMHHRRRTAPQLHVCTALAHAVSGNRWLFAGLLWADDARCCCQYCSPLCQVA
jgi:hypothetical protein